MESILSQLYAGELRPFEQALTSQTYIEHKKKCMQSRESLYQTLKSISPELESKFNEAFHDYSLLRTMEAEDMFCYGFSLGIRLLTEVFWFDSISENADAAPPRSAESSP